MSSKLNRDLILYEKCSPEAVAQGSAAQMFYFVQDAKADIATLATRLEALEVENARKETALATILGLLGNVEHKGGGSNAARMYADMLNDIRNIARRAREGGNADAV